VTQIRRKKMLMPPMTSVCTLACSLGCIGLSVLAGVGYQFGKAGHELSPDDTRMRIVVAWVGVVCIFVGMYLMKAWE
jgi:hypothetical protein